MKLYLFSLLVFLSLQVNASCLKEYDKITLSGSLVSRIYPGPPNYQDIKQGDQPIEAWILKLDNKLNCIDGLKPTDFYEGWQNEVRLMLFSDDNIDYKKFKNTHVAVSGTLYIAGAAVDLTAIQLDEISDIKIDK